jgi:dUTPase
MEAESNFVALTLTESAMQVLHNAGETPETYIAASAMGGLQLYNCGDDVVLPGRTKWSVFEEPPLPIHCGIKIEIPNGHVGIIKPTPPIVRTGLSTQQELIPAGKHFEEISVYFINVGERDTVVKKGTKVPAELYVVPCLTQYKLLSGVDFWRTATQVER